MTQKAKEDLVVLSYFDCLIRESDLSTLNNNNWLNDAIIGFYFVYLEKERYPSDKNILFVGPEVSQCLKESPSSELSIFLEPLEAKSKDYIYFAVNDSGKTSGGSHWSLLVFIRLENKFYHLDSSYLSNHQSALKLAQNLGKYLSSVSSRPMSDFQELESLQQGNSYDCGIYLVCNLENAAEYLLANGNIKNLPYIKKDSVKTKRQALLQLIEEFKENHAYE